MFRPFSRPLLCLFALYSLLWAMPSWADTVVVAKRIDLPGASLQDVRAQLVPGTDPSSVKVSLHAGKADIPALGWRRVGLTLDGSLRRDVQMRWFFDGTVQLAGAPGGALGNAKVNLVVDASANTLEINAVQGGIRIGAAFPLDQPSHAQVNLRNLPAGWLQGMLGTLWAGHITGGKLDADLAVDARNEGLQSSGDFTVADLKYATPTGSLVGDGVAGHGRFAFDGTSRPAQLALNGGLHGGVLQFGSVLARLPAHDVVLDVGADMQHSGFDINHLHVDDADALQVDGALSVDAKGNLQKLKLDHFQAHFPAAYDRYGQPWLDTMAAPNLHIAGQLDGHLDYAADTWRSFAFHTRWTRHRRQHRPDASQRPAWRHGLVCASRQVPNSTRLESAGHAPSTRCLRRNRTGVATMAALSCNHRSTYRYGKGRCMSLHWSGVPLLPKRNA